MCMLRKMHLKRRYIRLHIFENVYVVFDLFNVIYPYPLHFLTIFVKTYNTEKIVFLGAI